MARRVPAFVPCADEWNLWRTQSDKIAGVDPDDFSVTATLDGAVVAVGTVIAEVPGKAGAYGLTWTPPGVGFWRVEVTYDDPQSGKLVHVGEYDAYEPTVVGSARPAGYA